VGRLLFFSSSFCPEQIVGYKLGLVFSPWADQMAQLVQKEIEKLALAKFPARQ
jgi:hypothetical protein